jgi:uncharacterized Rmd1/YagE family protein
MLQRACRLPQLIAIRPCSISARQFHISRRVLAKDTHFNTKPKETTNLRKSASASLPLRAKATPTRGSIRPVSILTTGLTYNLSHLRKLLPAGSLVYHDAFWVPRWGPKGSEGEVFIFYSNGGAVYWGLDEEQARRFASQFLVPAGEDGQRLLRDAETEDVEFVTDPNE